MARPINRLKGGKRGLGRILGSVPIRRGCRPWRTSSALAGTGAGAQAREHDEEQNTGERFHIRNHSPFFARLADDCYRKGGPALHSADSDGVILSIFGRDLSQVPKLWLGHVEQG